MRGRRLRIIRLEIRLDGQNAAEALNRGSNPTVREGLRIWRQPHWQLATLTHERINRAHLGSNQRAWCRGHRADLCPGPRTDRAPWPRRHLWPMPRYL